MTSTVRNPWNQQVLAEVPLHDRHDVDRAIAAAHHALRNTRAQPPHERAEVLLKIAAGLREQRDAFAQTIMQEAGKPITLAEAEVGRAVVTFTAAADEARKSHAQFLDAGAYAPGIGHSAIVTRVPAGVVYGMTPFNFPLNLVAHKLAPAIACGAPIVLKPSPRTPLSTLKLVELAQASGAIKDSVQCVNTPNELAAYAIESDHVKVVSFTGSAPVGWKIKSLANKKKVTLELGGNAAVIVHEDADIAPAISMIATGAFAYAGQSCISVQRVLIHRSIYDTVRDQLVTFAREKIKTGDPADRATLVGPMIDEASRDRLLASIQSAQSRGANVLLGGQMIGPCVSPALLENVPADHALCAEEAFAPVAILIAYDTFDDAIRIVNASRYGLQAGVFTHDIRRVQQAYDELDVGAVLINQTPTFRIDNLPYGGPKDSGFGREGIASAMEEMTEPKVLIIRR